MILWLKTLLAAFAAILVGAGPLTATMTSGTHYDTPIYASIQTLTCGPIGSTASVHRVAPALRLAVTSGALGSASPCRVAANAVPEALSFSSRAAAREGLPGDLAPAGNRFFRGATSKSQDFKATGLPGGGYRLEFFSPANNPGYGKLYVQEIDSTGQVLREYKNTMGPEGLIETKWVHGGP